MYCKKCGTEQKDGQKFCPKCGEPFLLEDGKANMNDYKKDLQDAKDKMATKVDELTQLGKEYAEKKVQPQLNDKIEAIKSVNWEEKKTKSINKIKDFFSDTNKLRKSTIIIALIAVLWFFIFNHGFSASWIWWLFSISFIIAAFYKTESKDEHDTLKKARWSFALALFLGLVFVFHGSGSSSSFGGFDVDNINVKASNDQDMEIIAKMGRIRGEINAILPQVDALYNAHQQHLARGFQYASSPAWGKWQDCRNRINDLWNEYIKLAQKLSGNNDDVIEEAEASKEKMNRAFMDMFTPQY